MPKVKVAFDNRPKGEKVEVPYLGVFENGSTTEVDQTRWDRFVANAPGAERYADQKVLEVGTKAAEQATKEHHALREAAQAEETQAEGGEPEAKPLSKRSKAELVELAKGRVEGADDMNKDELIDALSQEG